MEAPSIYAPDKSRAVIDQTVTPPLLRSPEETAWGAVLAGIMVAFVAVTGLAFVLRYPETVERLLPKAHGISRCEPDRASSMRRGHFP